MRKLHYTKRYLDNGLGASYTTRTMSEILSFALSVFVAAMMMRMESGMAALLARA